MTDKPPRSVVPSGGVFRELSTRLKLILRLMGDGRVPIFLKLIPVASAVYLLFPDLAPGPLDDAAIIGLGGYLFVELCPAHVVKEHMDALTSVVDAQWREVPPEPEKKETDLIDPGG
jgi:hypothetical protein